MAIDLLHSVLAKGKNTATNQNQTVSASDAQATPQNLQVMRAMRALQAGQTLRGEIISVQGDEVQLAVLKDVIIDAKLSQSMNLTPGMMLSFQVKSNNSTGLSLMPLFTNTAADPNALKALDMAGIPVNERSVEMVQTLMEKGMPIDKQSIQSMYREVVANKDAAVMDLIHLRQLGVEVTADNLQQLSLYENNQHFLGQSFSDLGQALGEQLGTWMQEGNTEAVRNLLQQVRQLFGGEPATEPTETGKVVVSEGQLLGTAEGAAGAVSDEVLTLGKGNAGSLTEGASGTLQGEGALPSSEAATTAGTEGAVGKAAEQPTTWGQLLDSLLKETSPQKLTDAFQKLWDSKVKEQWLLEPEAVAEKEKVKELYDKLTKQVKQLESFLDTSPSLSANLSKAVQNTASNLDFLNQLNQMNAYIQLPLKLANQNAHGELYVYTNKKSLAKQEGKVTALLHLTMEHLGAMDIYVSLENNKVDTKFTLEKEEVLDFLEEHMDMLTQRLKKRGYDCEIRTGLRESTEEAVLKKMEQQQNSPMVLSTQAFDMRA